MACNRFQIALSVRQTMGKWLASQRSRQIPAGLCKENTPPNHRGKEPHSRPERSLDYPSRISGPVARRSHGVRSPAELSRARSGESTARIHSLGFPRRFGYALAESFDLQRPHADPAKMPKDWMDGQACFMRSATALAPTADAKLSQAPRTENSRRRRELALSEVVGRVPKIDCPHWAKPGHGPRFGWPKPGGKEKGLCRFGGSCRGTRLGFGSLQLACAGL